MSQEAQGKSLSDKVRLGELFTVDCPSRDALKHVSSLWGVLCLISLQEGTLRYSELRRKAVGISEKMLAQTLKRLEEDGFVARHAHPVIPPYVEYTLTPMGDEVAGHVATLADWIEYNIPRIMESRRDKGVA
ncbi:TPA: helix-turn-helix transcriptional regulator [Enterobacter cloacae]|nr:helix-turn-helix transcriptional regulator [Enterobacter cloacae]